MLIFVKLLAPVLVGGAVGGATIYGVVSSQTAPGDSPVTISKVLEDSNGGLEYGTAE